MKHMNLLGTLFVVSCIVATTVGVAFAHGIVSLNGAKDTNEWLAGFGSGGCSALPASNSGGIYKSSDGCTGPTGNEFIWTDAVGDQRTIHWGSTGDLDLKEFRVTGDSTTLYFLLEFSDITSCGSEYIAIAVNSNDASGTTFFPDNADTNLGSFGNGYERVIEVNTTSTGYWSDNSPFTSAGSSYCDANNNLWEISMPVAGLGLTWPASSGAYDFAVAVFCNDSGGICDVGGASDAMDVVTNMAGNTWNEVSDGSLDYSFTMGFSPSAITLRSLTARTGSALPWAGAAVAVGGLGALAAYRRRR